MFSELTDLVENSIFVIDLGDAVTLTAGGEDSGIEDKRHPYD